MGILDDIQNTQMQQVQQGAQQQGFAQPPQAPESPQQPISQFGGGQPSAQPDSVKAFLTGWLPKMQARIEAQDAPKSAGTRFRQGFGGGMMHAAGLETPDERSQKTNQQLLELGNQGINLQNSDRQQAAQQFQQGMVSIQTPYGIMQVPQKDAAGLMGKNLTGQYGLDKANIKRANEIVKVDGMPYSRNANGGLDPIDVNGLQKVLVDKSEATALHHPELEGESLPIKKWLELKGKVQSASGNIATGEGVFRQDKESGQLTQRLGSNPVVAGRIAGAAAQAAYRPIAVIGDDGKPQLLQASNPKAWIGRVPGNIGTQGIKQYLPAIDADARLNVMKQAAANPNGANDMVLLFNHIAMTGGDVKGMRMGEALTQAHMKARSIPEDVGVAWNKAVRGEQLSPEQRVNFLNLAQEIRDAKWDKADAGGEAFGVSRPTPKQATGGAPKVGDTKTFPNGKTGKWDGHGWVAQ